MYYSTNKAKIFYKQYNQNSTNIPFLFLHGFTGNGKSWQHIIKSTNLNSIIMDIPGHGKSAFDNLNNDYDINDFVTSLYMFLNDQNIKKINLCGYSMGGRIATLFTSKHPNSINSLIIESSCLGIKNWEIRENKFEEDNALAQLIITKPNSFLKSWENMDFFKLQKKRNNKEWLNQKKIRESHNFKQLAKSLLVFSKGNFPYLEEEFKHIDKKIIVINGTDDDKYIKIGKEMIYMNKNVNRFIVDEANHNVHLENPELFEEILIENCI